MKFSVTAAEQAPKSVPILLRGNLYNCIDEAHQIGYSYMEIHLRWAGQVDWARMKAFCEEKGFHISTIGTGMGYIVDKLSLTDGDLIVRKNAVKRLKEHIDLSEKLKCGVIIGSMKGHITETNHYRKYEGYCLDGIKQLADYAGSKGVPLFLEAINRYELNFLNTVDDTLDFINKLANPWVRILIDTFHMNIEEANLEESIARCGGKLGHVHLADSNRRYPGAGHLDFKKIINSLRRIHYDGYGALECLNYPNPRIAAKRGLELLETI
ncbi:MAG: sugar phosphate isomerase/epimerase family protein [Bacillota bacterium]